MKFPFFLSLILLIILGSQVLAVPFSKADRPEGRIPPILRTCSFLKIDSAIVQTKAINWPFIYPHDFKLSLHLGKRFLRMPDGTSFTTTSYAGSFELIWTQVLTYGLGYEGNFIAARDKVAPVNIHRINLNLGIILILDDREKHHFLFYLRPGIGYLRSAAGNVTRPGIGVGFAYEYSINSEWLLGPEILYYRYPTLDTYPYGFSGWTVALRLAYGK